MRRYCPVETYTDKYVEFDDRWSRSEIKRFGGDSADTIELMQQKIISIDLPLLHGVLSAPDQISEETLDDMQWEVFQWFISLPTVVVREVLDLGEAVRRQSLLIVEKLPDTDTSTKPQLTPTSSSNSQEELSTS